MCRKDKIFQRWFFISILKLSIIIFFCLDFILLLLLLYLHIFLFEKIIFKNNNKINMKFPCFHLLLDGEIFSFFIYIYVYKKKIQLYIIKIQNKVKNPFINISICCTMVLLRKIQMSLCWKTIVMIENVDRFFIHCNFIHFFYVYIYFIVSLK